MGRLETRGKRWPGALRLEGPDSKEQEHKISPGRRSKGSRQKMFQEGQPGWKSDLKLKNRVLFLNPEFSKVLIAAAQMVSQDTNKQ
ncbi:hypothetical protein Y1Q_0002642 [Alligator mississippiensis]|uniref:Uncharacterized protein n=1 Tax=Alligator mississippiensis TaxID=8496 RepID=A0A151NYY1_ALLMI|nr:hypothetical protein Y1Q_0002642 [Alligator mississippiensis]